VKVIVKIKYGLLFSDTGYFGQCLLAYFCADLMPVTFKSHFVEL